MIEVHVLVTGFDYEGIHQVKAVYYSREKALRIFDMFKNHPKGKKIIYGDNMIASKWVGEDEWVGVITVFQH